MKRAKTKVIDSVLIEKMKSKLFYRDGNLYWRNTISSLTYLRGKIAGTKMAKKRYRTFAFDRKRYLSHRVIYAFFNGHCPSYIDHINGDSMDNRIENLRASSPTENMKNVKLHSKNKTGISGVALIKGSYRVRIGTMYMNVTPDFFEACCLRKSAELLHCYDKNHGKSGRLGVRG